MFSVNHRTFLNGQSHNGLFREAARYRPSAARGSAVEAESELLRVGLEMFWGDRALVRAQNPTLEQAGHSMHSGHDPHGLDLPKCSLFCCGYNQPQRERSSRAQARAG